MGSKKSSKSKLSSRQRGFFVFIGVLLCVVTGGVLWFNGRVNSLDCRRVESTQLACDISVAWLGLLPLAQQHVYGLTGAAVEPNCSTPTSSASQSSPQQSCTYSVTLATTSGPVDLSPALASGGNEEHKYEVVEQINRFITDTTMPALSVAQSELGPQTAVLGGLFVIGVVLIGVNTAKIVTARRQTV